MQLFKFVKQGDTEGSSFNLDSRTKEHGLKLEKSHFSRKVRKHYFYNRVINEWNRLPHGKKM